MSPLATPTHVSIQIMRVWILMQVHKLTSAASRVVTAALAKIAWVRPTVKRKITVTATDAVLIMNETNVANAMEVVF